MSSRARAALRLTEMLTPAAALGIACPAPGCRASVGERCAVLTGCQMRLLAARAELHSLLIMLGVGL